MKQRLLHASVPALLVASALGGDVRCKNDGIGDAQDTGCNSHEPICITADNREPATHDYGEKCAPCVNYFENPAEPDWGCAEEAPLCLDAVGNRPNFGSAGAQCAPYPCHNTRGSEYGIDEGCTSSEPICVDALGNEPHVGKPGMRCVSSVEPSNKVKRSVKIMLDSPCTCGKQVPCNCGKQQVAQESMSPSIGAWGLDNSKRSVSDKPRCLVTGHTERPSLVFTSVSVCGGCPFGLSRQCDLGKLSW